MNYISLKEYNLPIFNQMPTHFEHRLYRSFGKKFLSRIPERGPSIYELLNSLFVAVIGFCGIGVSEFNARRRHQEIQSQEHYQFQQAELEKVKFNLFEINNKLLKKEKDLKLCQEKLLSLKNESVLFFGLGSSKLRELEISTDIEFLKKEIVLLKEKKFEIFFQEQIVSQSLRVDIGPARLGKIVSSEEIFGRLNLPKLKEAFLKQLEEKSSSSSLSEDENFKISLNEEIDRVLTDITLETKESFLAIKANSLLKWDFFDF